MIRQLDFPAQSAPSGSPEHRKVGAVHGKQPQHSGNQEASVHDLQKRTDQLNQVMQIFNYNIRFSLDRESKRVVVKIVDPGTEEVVRQIPPEEMLQIMKRIDQMLGLILDEKV